MIPQGQEPIDLPGLCDLQGQVAVVTGASSGLGERFAKVLHAAGAEVVAVARRGDRLTELAAAYPGITAVQADVTIDADVERVVAGVLEKWGRVDVLVNNAGMGTPAPAVDEGLDAFRYVFELNVVGLFHLARTAARAMLAAGSGSIINVSSMYGLVSSWPIPNASYTASKGAVVQLTRELACQWAAGGVRVNALAPGFFPSEGTAGLTEDRKALAWVERGCPTRRMGRVDELDGALLFLAGRGSTYVTGHTLVVDGGWSAH